MDILWFNYLNMSFVTVNRLWQCLYKRNAVQMTCPIACCLAGISNAESYTASSISIFKHCQHLVIALNPLKRAKNRWKLPKIAGRWTFQRLRLRLAVQRIELICHFRSWVTSLARHDVRRMWDRARSFISKEGNSYWSVWTLGEVCHQVLGPGSCYFCKLACNILTTTHK